MLRFPHRNLSNAAPKRCTNNTPPLQAPDAVFVLAPAVARCTSRITISAARFRQPSPMYFANFEQAVVENGFTHIIHSF